MKPLETLRQLADTKETAQHALKEAVKQAVAIGIPKSQIAKAARISRPTIITWTKEDD